MRQAALVAISWVLGAAAGLALPPVLQQATADPAVALWARMVLGAALASLAMPVRDVPGARDALLLSASGAWAGALHPLPAALGLLAALAVAAGSPRPTHRGVALAAAVAAAAALCWHLPPALGPYRVPAAILALGAPLVTVAFVDEDVRLRAVCAAASLTAGLALVPPLALRLHAGATPDPAAALLMAVGLVSASAVAMMRLRRPTPERPPSPA